MHWAAPEAVVAVTHQELRVPGPARAGRFIYAKDADRVGRFYQQVAGMVQPAAAPDLIVLESPDIQLLVHTIPEHIAKAIVITAPPQRRENAALKFSFAVRSLSQARADAERLGGIIFDENWNVPGSVVRNAVDPESNVFQVRESAT